MVDESRFDSLRSCVVEVLQVEEGQVVGDARFGEDFNADSLDLVELGMVIEDRFGVELTEEDLSCIVTVAHAYEIVSSKLD